MEIVTEAEFMSDARFEGYVDTDRPTKRITRLAGKKIVTVLSNETNAIHVPIVSTGGPTHAPPFGMPPSRDELAMKQHAMRREYVPRTLDRPERGLFWPIRAFRDRIRVFVRLQLQRAMRALGSP
jgi:hypothetical protein